MAHSEVESQPPAGNVVLRHTPGRTVAFVAIVLVWAVYIGLHLVFHPARILWLDALGGLAAAADREGHDLVGSDAPRARRAGLTGFTLTIDERTQQDLTRGWRAQCAGCARRRSGRRQRRGRPLIGRRHCGRG